MQHYRVTLSATDKNSDFTTFVEADSKNDAVSAAKVELKNERPDLNLSDHWVWSVYETAERSERDA
jgi:hypothetical protein